MSRHATRLAVIGVLTLGASCAQDVEDIDRTQPNRVAKSELEGTWYYMETVTGVPSTSAATFIGETSRMEKIVFAIEEDYLLAYRSYPLFPGSDNVEGRYDYNDPAYHESPVAAFPILSHFDVQREYNSSTGEQSNVITENESDRPWYEREYMRVDWSTNAITNFDFISEWFANPVEGAFFIDQEREEERSVYFERDGSGELVYFDVPRQLLVEPDFWGCIFSSPWYSWGTEDCSAAQIELVSSFARTEPRRDFEPLPYDDRQLTRFGFFRSERYVYDPYRGVLESARSRQANRFNIWQETYRREGDGSYSRDADGHLIPIPHNERQVRTIPYYASTLMPDDNLIWGAAYETMGEWNEVGREAAALAMGVDMSQVPDVFVFCANPVAEGDHEACGPPGFTVRPGDLRYSTLYWIDTFSQDGPLGYGPAAVDPETGEIVSGRAYVYGDGINRYASYGVDVIRFMNGDLQPAELMDAEHIRDEVRQRAEASTNLDRVAPELRDVPLGPPRERDPERFQLRDMRRQNLRPFDRSAVTARFERAREAGLSALIGGEEYERALASWLEVPPDQLTQQDLVEHDPSLWLSPTHLQEVRRQRMRAMARGLDFDDMIDPNVLGLARAYEGRTDYDQIFREIRTEIFRSTALHEVGHTVGLRHNFQGTYDSMNFFDEYWNLRQENMQTPQTMFDLYATAAVTENQIAGRMLEYAYSSIMDYGLRFNTDIHGLGRYDRAAFVYGYTGTPAQNGFVEVYRKRAGELGRAGEILTSTDEIGGYFDDPTTPFIPYLERWHYTTIMNSFPELQDAFDREWMRLDDFHALRQAGGPEMAVRVPYLFCGDEWTEALLSCQVFDAGADPFEMTRNVIEEYRAYYYFVNFKRDRFAWDVWDALYTAFYYTYLPVSNYYQNWYLAPEGADEVMDNYYWLATNMGINLVAETLATPPYGTFCTTPEGNLFQLFEEPGLDPSIAGGYVDYYLDTYCDRNGPFYEVPQGDGRRRFSAYDVDSGYNFGFLPLEAGHYWHTLAAIWAMFDPEAYVLGTDADLGSFAISYYDFFDAEVTGLANAVISEDYDTYSPVIEVNGQTGTASTGTLHYPIASPVFDTERFILIDPETGQDVDDVLGPSRATTAICQPCDSHSQCNGYTGFLEGTFCQPISDDSEFYCLQDCFEDESLCASNETCDDFGNCVPTSGTCEGHVTTCSAETPHGTCPPGQNCIDGTCQDLWPIVQTDATFASMDDLIFYGMLYSTFSYSTRYNDQLNVLKIGTDETIQPGRGFELVTFTDPISGDTYGAIREACELPPDAPVGGSTGLCEPCDVDDECAGYNGQFGGVWCQPLDRPRDEIWYCVVDCTEVDNCPDGTTCNEVGNCVPDDLDCGPLAGSCSASYPLGECPDGLTCDDGTCVTPQELSAQCEFNLTDEGGGVQMVLQGQEFGQRYNDTLEAYWSDDASDPDRELDLFRQFSRAHFELENHVAKINIIRAVFQYFGTVY